MDKRQVRKNEWSESHQNKKQQILNENKKGQTKLNHNTQVMKQQGEKEEEEFADNSDRRQTHTHTGKARLISVLSPLCLPALIQHYQRTRKMEK